MMSDDKEQEHLLLEGWLTKQGAIHKTWKKRYFCNKIDNPYVLQYFSDEHCKSLKGKINLGEVVTFRTTTDKGEPGAKQKIGLSLITPDRSWKLIAQGTKIGDYWTTGIQKILSSIGEERERTKKRRKQQIYFSGESESSAETGTSHENESESGSSSCVSSLSVQEEQQKIPEPSIPGKSVAQAAFAYEGQNSNELSFAKGDFLTILEMEDENGWWAAEINGKRGWVSSFYIKLCNR